MAWQLNCGVNNLIQLLFLCVLLPGLQLQPLVMDTLCLWVSKITWWTYMLKSKLEFMINVYFFRHFSVSWFNEWTILPCMGSWWVPSISRVRSLAQPNFDSSPSTTMLHLLIGLDMDLIVCTGTRFNTLSHASPLGFLNNTWGLVELNMLISKRVCKVSDYY